MTIDIIIGVLGGLLIFVAIVGGGFELRELKVPKVGGGARSASAVVGAVLLFFAFGLESVPAPPGPGPDPTPPSQTTLTPVPTVDFTIHDALGEDQVTEKIQVQIDDRVVGTLIVDIVHTEASLTVTAPAGRHSYTLTSLTMFEFDDGSVEEFSGYGHGQIDATEGKAFAIKGEVGEEQLNLFLE